MSSKKSTLDRRDFIKKSSGIGLACGLACLCHHSIAADEGKTEPAPDPTKVNFCGHICPKECPMKKAGISGNIEEKKKAYEMWKIQERYGLEFDPNTVFCNGCKTEDQLGVAVANCPVRACAVEKKMDSCIQCDQLKTCDKKLWTEFPGFHKHIIKMQDQYFASLN